MSTVLVQRWTETEAGWGRRPDGISIHFNRLSHKQYIEDYWKSMKTSYGSTTPREYSYPEGEPKLMEVVLEGATELVLAAVLKEESFREYENYPTWLKDV